MYCTRLWDITIGGSKSYVAERALVYLRSPGNGVQFEFSSFSILHLEGSRFDLEFYLFRLLNFVVFDLESLAPMFRI